MGSGKGMPMMYEEMTMPLVTKSGPSSLHPQCPSSVCSRLKNSQPLSRTSLGLAGLGILGSEYSRPSQYCSRKLCGRLLFLLCKALPWCVLVSSSWSSATYSHMWRPSSTLSRHLDKSVLYSAAALVSLWSDNPTTLLLGVVDGIVEADGGDEVALLMFLLLLF